MSDPRYLGFFMPAEWHPHSATLMSWPSNPETWPGERLERVEKVYLNMLAALTRHEPVVLIVGTLKLRKRVEDLLVGSGVNTANLRLWDVPSNDVWARDFGPVMIGKPEADGSWTYALNNFHYNAWGCKYPPYDADDAIPRRYAMRHKIRRFEPGMVLEGGSIDTNGAGTVLTTKSVLLNPNRNPEMDQAQIEERMRKYLGHEQILWLNRGLAGDDTDGHIDDLSRFVDGRTIVTMVCEDKADVNHDALAENLDILRSATAPDGSAFDVRTLPLPVTRIEGTTVDGSEYVPASYANFYVANGCVLVPVYDPRHDEQALAFFRAAFPGRSVYGIPCADLVWGQGSIHCVTMQLFG